MVKLRNLNFRQSRSERAGDSSYKNFRQGVAKKFNNIKFLNNKYGKS
jgi:hypothetical protein